MSLFRRFLSSNIGQLVIEIVLVAVPVLLLAVFLNLVFASFLQRLVGDMLFNILEAAIIAGVFFLALRRIEHRTLSDVGLARQQWLRQLLISFLFGGALMTVVVLALSITGSYHITNTTPLAVVQLISLIVALCLLVLLLTRTKKLGLLHYVLFALLVFGFLPMTVSLLILVAGVIQEEFVFRGILFRKLEGSFGSWIALIVSALLFGIIHWLSPNATLVSGVAIMLTAGVLIAALYILTRSLWWAMGIHLGWNFFEGSVFGVQLSGHSFPSFFSSAMTGPVAWTGGSFGPEAGLASILIVGSVGLFLCFRAARQQRILPRHRSKHGADDTRLEHTGTSVNL
jgi:membrane protease YdiL (CAAX protease family)